MNKNNELYSSINNSVGSLLKDTSNPFDNKIINTTTDHIIPLDVYNPMSNIQTNNNNNTPSSNQPNVKTNNLSNLQTNNILSNIPNNQNNIIHTIDQSGNLLHGSVISNNINKLINNVLNILSSNESISSENKLNLQNAINVFLSKINKSTGTDLNSSLNNLESNLIILSNNVTINNYIGDLYNISNLLLTFINDSNKSPIISPSTILKELHNIPPSKNIPEHVKLQINNYKYHYKIFKYLFIIAIFILLFIYYDSEKTQSNNSSKLSLFSSLDSGKLDSVKL